MPYADREERLRQNREANRRWYARNRQKQIDRAAARRRELKAMVQAAKVAPCTDCGGEFPPVAMDFDHVDPSTKAGNLGDLIRRGSKRAVEEEMAKCELVCSNCHRVREEERRLGKPACAG